MSIHVNPSVGLHTFENESEYRSLFRKSARLGSWRIFPYGWWEEKGGSIVVFDRKYRPICRKHSNCSVEVVPPETWITYRKQHFLYRGLEHPSDDPATRARILGAVERLGILDELKRRRALERQGTLPRWSTRSEPPRARAH